MPPHRVWFGISTHNKQDSWQTDRQLRAQNITQVGGEGGVDSTDRQADRQTDRHGDRQIDRQADLQADRQADR